MSSDWAGASTIHLNPFQARIRGETLAVLALQGLVIDLDRWKNEDGETERYREQAGAPRHSDKASVVWLADGGGVSPVAISLNVRTLPVHSAGRNQGPTAQRMA